MLVNDSLNHALVIPDSVSVTFISSSDPKITLNGRQVEVALGTAAGDYTLVYKICENLNPTNCDTAIVYVPVFAAPIEAVYVQGVTSNG